MGIIARFVREIQIDFFFVIIFINSVEKISFLYNTIFVIHSLQNLTCHFSHIDLSLPTFIFLTLPFHCPYCHLPHSHCLISFLISILISSRKITKLLLHTLFTNYIPHHISFCALIYHAKHLISLTRLPKESAFTLEFY